MPVTLTFNTAIGSYIAKHAHALVGFNTCTAHAPLRTNRFTYICPRVPGKNPPYKSKKHIKENKDSPRSTFTLKSILQIFTYLRLSITRVMIIKAFVLRRTPNIIPSKVHRCKIGNTLMMIELFI